MCKQKKRICIGDLGQAAFYACACASNKQEQLPSQAVSFCHAEPGIEIKLIAKIIPPPAHSRRIMAVAIIPVHTECGKMSKRLVGHVFKVDGTG